ncbi:ABC transporter transmembrane region family protein [Sphingomonas sp. S17]|jgi:ATP-binding cassette subfamily B protein|uniref:ABC transporter ATP-binding protein/permease n=3 Tax=Sphingomonas TaxID=13687 RepID=A0A411LLF2_SPHPI|nr:MULTISPECIES: ABC transporter ATP-binding protein/permease [Sphingomonas]EGI54703.1 ABC transporter transmembrane region family protein [Sphingomonas sp. S17]MBQ1481832.1 ABC transporter ATP-binding protein/permease [Sphingomonas sp.]MCM3680122.1 ABC transporter ATP-binding protein/permease [Sphingomonas paucimobilis]MDG5970312.1 ABC transporter ATP-binding protein/permease [Sphingomonas paucimobilis]NNG56270.1 ABC transporter ATP-binding protein/permease [Sphingomonas paucimobilis]
MPPLDPTAGAPDRPLIPTLRRFLPYLWPAGAPALRARIVAAMLLVILSKLLQVLGAAYTLKYAIDRMAGGDRGAVMLIVLLVIGYAAARFGTTLFDNLRNAVFEIVGQDATRRLSADVFRHLHRLSLRFHLERRTGAVTKVVERGTKSIDTMLYFLLFNIAPTVLELGLVLAIFGRSFGPVLVVTTLAMVVLYIGFTRKVTDWRNALRNRMNDLDTGAVAHAVDSLLNFETVKYFNAEEREAQRYENGVAAYARAATKSENSLAWLNVGQAAITSLMLGFAMAWVVREWSRGAASPGDVVFVSTLLSQLFRPLDLLGMVYRTIRQGVIDMGAMFDLIDTPAEVVDAPHALPLAVRGGHVRFDHVVFGYEPDRAILKGLTLDIPAGTTCAVVGPSGAGKSTLARLLYRFYDVTEGAITIDGQRVSDVTQDSLRAAIGIVPQDTVLFNDTIGYNIAYGREGADQSDVERAAKGAAIADFIERQPQGYATRVGERGLKLSGGEKQRVAIARTLLKDPPILILDEATSALDSRTEADILATLQAIERGRTTLVIAHRLSTIAHADQIVVLDGGHVVERGTHGELLAKGGLYAEMWARQAAEVEQAEEDAVLA